MKTETEIIKELFENWDGSELIATKIEHREHCKRELGFLNTLMIHSKVECSCIFCEEHYDELENRIKDLQEAVKL